MGYYILKVDTYKIHGEHLFPSWVLNPYEVLLSVDSDEPRQTKEHRLRYFSLKIKYTEN